MLYDSERWDEAWAILDIMLEEGVCPTVVRSYTAILSRARSSR
jgi:pentatricopeptide repeat protein